MITPYSKIVSAKVLSLKNQTIIGEVADLVIKKTELSISGLILRKSPLDVFSKPKVISNLDIIEVSNGVVLVTNEECVTNIDEAVRIKEAYKNGYFGVGQRVITKSGKHLGRVYDFLTESPDYCITKFYVKGTITERIIHATSVLKIEGKTITVKDDFEIGKVSAPAVEAEMA